MIPEYKYPTTTEAWQQIKKGDYFVSPQPQYFCRISIYLALEDYKDWKNWSTGNYWKILFTFKEKEI